MDRMQMSGFDFPNDRIVHGGIVADEKNGTMTVFFAQQVVEKLFSFKVEMGVRLIEEQKIRLGDDSSSQ